MHVLVRTDMYGFRCKSGQLTLGTRCDLKECGSEESMEDGQLVYKNVLHYVPSAQNGAIRRSMPFTVPIQCNYYRHGIRPLWRNPARFKNLKTSYDFALRTVNGDWVPDPMMITFYLGQPIHFQTTTNLTVPGTKLFIHRCYATASPALNSTPRYTVIEIYGCMVDSRHETCSSHFVPPRTNSTINFIVDAFQFNALSPLVNKYYMHCTMVVTSSMVTQSTKSCHYEKNTKSWVELEGNHSVCSCCDSVCIEDVTLPTGSASSDSLLVLGKRGDHDAPIQHSGETYDEAKVPEHSDNAENDEGAVEADGDGR
ncbi:zona pellucida sperm-binding protein 3-like [Huso huso]|uniref:Zona pellucida sperm-binding protein 3-like n=1 Tax=Huso huso TaxID=61971 RepID=A0ABR0YPB3_HUSHU